MQYPIPEGEHIMAKNDPWLPAPFQQLSQEVDRLFDELIHRPWGVSRTRESAWTPQLDLYEDAATFVLEADLPGVQEKDVSVTIEGGDLVLRGRRTFERVCDEESFYCRERRSGSHRASDPRPRCGRLLRAHGIG